jgi:hypothetical protein
MTSDDKGDFVSPAATTNVNLLFRVLMIPVNDGIGQGLA